MKAINNNVILKKCEEENTSSGIILSNNEYNVGIVVTFDEKIKELKEGSKVVYKHDSATSFRQSNTLYIIVNFNDILAIID